MKVKIVHEKGYGVYDVETLPRIGEWVIIKGTRLIVKEINHAIQEARTGFTNHFIEIIAGR